MTIRLDLPSEVVDRLTEEARKRGVSLDVYLVQSILEHGSFTDASEGQLSRAEAGARILEIQSRVKPDPEGLTSRDYINHGRR
jgi:hypothetical protein